MDKPLSLKKVSQAYEQKRNGKAGRFGKLNPCYGCGKSAGDNYYSHPLTDMGFEDLGLCLCKKCGETTSDMLDPLEFIEFCVKHGGMSREDADRIKPSWEPEAVKKRQGARVS